MESLYETRGLYAAKGGGKDHLQVHDHFCFFPVNEPLSCIYHFCRRWTLILTAVWKPVSIPPIIVSVSKQVSISTQKNISDHQNYKQKCTIQLFSLLFLAFLKNTAKTLRRSGKKIWILNMCLPFEATIVILLLFFISLYKCEDWLYLCFDDLLCMIIKV